MNQVRLNVQGRENWVYTHLIAGRDCISIGRGPENDIDLNDLHASSRHVMVEHKGEGYSIRDLDSRNGTLLNGNRLLAERLLVHGDRIRVGMTDMTFLTDGDEAFDKTGSGTSSDNAAGDHGALEEISSEALEEEPMKGGQSEEELEKELRKARETIRLLKISSEFVRLLATKPAPLQMVSTALRLMAKHTHAENGFIMQIDPLTKQWSVRARHGEILDWTAAGGDSAVQLPMSLTVVEQVIRTGEPVVSLRTLKDPRFDSSHSVALLGINSCLCFPLRSNGKPEGVAYVDRRGNPEPFSRREEMLFAAFTDQLAKMLYR